MAESRNPEKSLLENESIRNQIIPYIQEEILLPSVAEGGSDIEILEENITKKTLKKKRKNKLKNELHKMKKLHSTQDAKTDVCGIQVTIKSLLKIDEVRKQIAPYIEEVVIDCSDSDTEENNASAELVHKNNEELTDEQILDKVKDRVAKSLPNLKKKVKSAKLKRTNNHLTANNKVMDNNKSLTPEKIHVLDLTDDVSDDDITLSDRMKNKKVAKKNKSKTKKIADFSESNQSSIILENHCEGLIIDENIFVIDGLDQSQEVTEPKSDITDLPITESDDWYYLNIASAPKDRYKESSIEDDILIIQNSLKSNYNSNNVEVEAELLPAPSNKIDTLLLIPSNKTETLLPTPSNKIEILPTPSNKLETEKSVNVAVPRRRIKGKRKKRFTVYKRRNISVRNKNDKEKSSLNIDNRSQKANLGNKNSTVTCSQAEDQTPLIIENNTNSNERLTFSHELIPIIKKEATEPMDNLCSEVPQPADVDESTNEIDSNDDSSLNNGVLKPMLKPYRIKEVTADFYRDEEKIYKTYQRISAKTKSRLMTIQNRMSNSSTISTKLRSSGKSFFKKRSKLSLECSKCGKQYARHQYLRRHERHCKPIATVKTVLQCPKCSYKTSGKYQYHYHVASHVDEDVVRGYERYLKVQCTMCKLNREAKQRESKCIKCQSYYKYLCRMCGRDYTTYGNLRAHVIRNIQLLQGRSCHRCGRGDLVSLCALKRHIKGQCAKLPYEDQGKISFNKIPQGGKLPDEDQGKMVRNNIRRSGKLPDEDQGKMVCNKIPQGGELPDEDKGKIICNKIPQIPAKLSDEEQGKIICNKIPYVRLVRHDKEKSKETSEMNTYYYIQCSNCDIFSTTSDRQAKCETCHADVSYKCELCNEFLPSYSILQSHAINVHIMNAEMCLETKKETLEDLEVKNECDEINYSCDKGKQIDDVKEHSIKEEDVSTNYDRPNEQKSESSLIKKDVETLDIFDKFTASLKEHAVLERLGGDDDEITDESNDGMNEVPTCSDNKNIKIHDATLSDIVNSNAIKEEACDSQLNEKCLEDTKDFDSLKRKYKANGIKRYCLRCDKTKKDLDVIRIGLKKEICEKCRSELLYQCVKCKRKSKNYFLMLDHWKRYCALLPPHSTFIVKLTAPEKFNNSSIYNRMQRHQCRLCSYSSNLKNRLMLHLQMHSWKDIKSAVLKPENHSDTPA